MKQLTVLITVLALWALPAMAAHTNSSTTRPVQVDPAPPGLVTLNDRVTIQDGVIRLGDVFQGADEYGDRVIAYGPRPGSRAVFDARWLRRVANTFKLDWRPRSAAQRVIVVRESQVISKSAVEALLFERLIAEGGDPSSRVTLANRSFRLNLPVGEDYLLGIEQMTYDAASGRFSAILAWGNAKDERRRVTGRLERMVEVPVLANRLMGGDLIQKADLTWIAVAQSRLARNAITDASQLIGMSSKRSLSAGRPVSANDVRPPTDVSKGETVTMVLTTPVMRLTAKGRALEAGAKGDTIRITNSQTRTVVEGIITGPGQVRIDVAVSLAMR